MKTNRITRFEGEKGREKGFDRSVTARLNWVSSFICNKTSMPGGGLAEGRRQSVAEIVGDRAIADIVRDRKSKTVYHKGHEGHKVQAVEWARLTADQCG